MLYLLTTVLSNRAAGLTAAILILIRERNSIALTNVIEVSHVKLVMSDVPTMAIVLVFALLCMLWLKNENGKGYLALAAGGALGLALLLRSQAILILPVVFLCAMLAYKRQLRLFLMHAALFIAGISMVIMPWLIRNYLVSGKVTIENSELYLPAVAVAYSSPDKSIAREKNESEVEYYARLRSQIFEGVIERPDEVLRFYAIHFFHNEVSAVIYLPLPVKFYETQEYVKQMGIWKGWRGDLSRESAFLLFLNISLIAFGLGSSWRHSWIATLTILMIHIAYSLSVVPFRLSGWRLILPVDWISAVFYSIGLVQIIFVAGSLFPQYISSPAM